MKKVILAGAALALCAQISNAQISIAPEAGIHLANMSAANDLIGLNLKSKVGLRAGANVNIQLGSGLFLQPGLFYTMRGCMQKQTDMGITDKVSLRLNYLELPVNLGYQYSLGKSGTLFATAGSYLAYGLKAKTVETISSAAGSDKFVTDGKFGDDVKRMDFGLNFGLGYKLPVGVYIRAQYNLGLMNINPTDDVTVKHKGFAFTLGYEFKLKSKPKVKTGK